ncbi:hypothetical protein JEQ12_017191 [Ovis aries]|uniref:Uncharacterized protein n=1 Tax=Ovis aries TaxID=9940 RepID=A0A836A1L9_SHEEP|nr:hypothetical protein JEQ12_017191 [Ovis aries]
MRGGLLLRDEAPNFKASTTISFILCTMELGRAAKLAPEFAKRKIKMIALSIDSLCFPITDDKNGVLAIQLGMLDPAENDEKGMPVTAHVAFVLVLIINQNCPSSTQLPLAGTLMRFSFQLRAEKKEVTLVEWKNGDRMMVLPTIPEEEAKRLFPKGVFSPKSSHLARNTSTTPLAIGSLWSWCWSCPPNTVSQRTAAVHHVSLQQAIKNILV